MEEKFMKNFPHFHSLCPNSLDISTHTKKKRGERLFLERVFKQTNKQKRKPRNDSTVSILCFKLTLLAYCVTDINSHINSLLNRNPLFSISQQINNNNKKAVSILCLSRSQQQQDN